MITKQTIEDVFAKYYVIDPPKNILVLDKPAVSMHGQTLVMYRGLQPKWRGDVIILTPQGDDETLIHETLHAQYFTNEPLTNVAGKILVVKYRISKRFKRFFIRHKKRFSVRTRRGRTVNYQLCSGCFLCNDLTQLKMYAPQGANPMHYVLMSD